MGMDVIAGRAAISEILDFKRRVSVMRPKRTVSERLRELMNADVKKWRKGKGKK